MINERELAIEDRENQIDYAIQKGREEIKAKVARTALGMGMAPETIVELTGLSLDAVMRLQEELEI